MAPGVAIGATHYANKETEEGKYLGKMYTITISSHVYYTHDESFLEDVFMNPLTEMHEEYDNERWQKRYLLELCTIIKNSYYFENSDVLEKIIAWAKMEEDAEEQRKEDAIQGVQY